MRENFAQVNLSFHELQLKIHLPYQAIQYAVKKSILKYNDNHSVLKRI